MGLTSTRTVATVAATLLLVAGCGGDDPDVGGGDGVAATEQAGPGDAGDDAAADGGDGDAADGDAGGGSADTVGSATVTVDGTTVEAELVLCLRDVVVPEAGGVATSTAIGVSTGTPADARGPVRELAAFGGPLASGAELSLQAIAPALEVGPLVAYERWEPVDGELEDRVKVVDGTTTYAAVGELDVTVDGTAVTVDGTLAAISRPSGDTTTPYEGDPAGELTIELRCG